MLKEFALDPELLSNWQDFRFFVAQFGAAQGRLISRFPKSWKAMVKEAAQGTAGEVEYLRIVDALERLDSSMFVREFDYQKGHQWLRNAIDENSKRPFHAILSTKADGNVANLIVGTLLDPTNPPPLWVVPTSVHIDRVPDAMSQCVEALLSQCDEVLFVDPYFGPGKQKHTGPLKRFLQAIASRGPRRSPSRIEYHCGNQDQDVGKFQTDMDQWIKPWLPNSMTLKVIRWNKDQMHNRYILTDRGGVMFGHGLDKDDQHPVGRDTVSLLDDTTCKQLMVDYSDKSQKLIWLGQSFSVTGA